MPSFEDLTGQKFGRLTAIRYDPGKWLCRCDCGGSVRVLAANLKKGNSTSCGCKRRESQFKHGMSGTPQWHAWQAMRQRCENPNDPAYPNYGGRGIKVCDRWQEFKNFVADMGLRPKGYELDRIDNDGPYSPENCRWVTSKANKHNKRTNTRITWEGETLPVTVWAERLGLHPRTLFNRLHRGWSLERAMTAPTQSKGSSNA